MMRYSLIPGTQSHQSPASRLLRWGGGVAIATLTLTSLPPSPAHALPWGRILRQVLPRGVQILQLSTLSKKNEIALGNQLHQNLQRRGTRFSRDRVLRRYVNRVGQRLVKSGVRRKFTYQFEVIDSPQVNAFATMGGKVYATTGLLKTAANEAELASVLAHEIGHNDLKHLLKQIRQRAITTGLAQSLTRSQAAGIGAELLVNRPKGRSDEHEADAYGLNMLRRANYATSAMPSFMEKLLRPRQSPTFLSTHPAVPERVNRLKGAIQSGAKNECDITPTLQTCGLDEQDYQRRIKSRL